MLEPLRAWLNGKKEYYTGVALYAQLGSNTALLNLFKKGPSPFCTRRLEEELLAICNDLKSKLHVDPSRRSATVCIDTNNIATDKRSPSVEKLQDENEELEEKVGELEETVYDLEIHVEELEDQVEDLEKKVPKEPLNPELYEAAKAAADKQYKQVMNDRAILFSLANGTDYTDPNTPAKIAARVKLSLDVVQGFQKASQLFDKADYVKEHGRLADQDDNQDEIEYDHLADHQVKQALDNLRKNYNKMKKREQTPERIALQQKHEANIKKLLNRWRSLT